MKGYRTILIGLALAVAPAAIEYLTKVDWNVLLGAKGGMFVGGVLMVVMRLVTTTPVASATEKLALWALACMLPLLQLAPARAADMPVKAIAQPFAYPSGSGFYFGVGSVGGGGPANVNVAGVNDASLVTNQISANILAGYAWNVPNSSKFLAIEGWGGWQNFNGKTPGFSFDGPLTFKERFIFGAPVADIASFFPTWGLALPTFPVLPAGQSITTTKAYMGATLTEDDISLNFGPTSNRVWTVAPGITVGVLGRLTSGSVIDTFVEVKFDDRGVCVGNTMGLGCGTVHKTYLAGVALKW